MCIKPEWSGFQIFGAIVGIIEAKTETMNPLAGIHDVTKHILNLLFFYLFLFFFQIIHFTSDLLIFI